MDEIDIIISKILSAFNIEADAEIAAKLTKFEYINSDDNVINSLHNINGVGYEIDENVYSLPSMSVNGLNERKNHIIISHQLLASKYYDSLAFSKRLQKKLLFLNRFYDVLFTKYYSPTVI